MGPTCTPPTRSYEYLVHVYVCMFLFQRADVYRATCSKSIVCPERLFKNGNLNCTEGKL